MNAQGVTEFLLVNTSGWPPQVGIDRKNVSAPPQSKSAALVDRAMVRGVIAAADRVAPHRDEADVNDRGPGAARRIGVVLVAFLAYRLVE